MNRPDIDRPLTEALIMAVADDTNDGIRAVDRACLRATGASAHAVVVALIPRAHRDTSPNSAWWAAGEIPPPCGGTGRSAAWPLEPPVQAVPLWFEVQMLVLVVKNGCRGQVIRVYGPVLEGLLRSIEQHRPEAVYIVPGHEDASGAPLWERLAADAHCPVRVVGADTGQSSLGGPTAGQSR